MRTILAACVALGAMGFALTPSAQADVTIRTDNGPYWRYHHGDSDWQARREFREREYRREAWVRDHCVRDWTGAEYCRR